MEVGKMLTSLIFLVIALVAIWVYVSIVSPPKRCDQVIVGDKRYVLAALKACVEKCWSSHNFGKDPYNEDCYIINLTSEDDIGKEQIESFFTSIPVKAYFNSLDKSVKYQIKIRYNYTGQEISLIKFG